MLICQVGKQEWRVCNVEQCSDGKTWRQEGKHIFYISNIYIFYWNPTLIFLPILTTEITNVMHFLAIQLWTKYTKY